MGSKKLWILVEQAKTVFAEEIAVVEGAADDPEAMAQALHSLKGTAANLGYQRLAAFARRASALSSAVAQEEARNADLTDIARQSEVKASTILDRDNCAV